MIPERFAQIHRRDTEHAEMGEESLIEKSLRCSLRAQRLCGAIFPLGGWGTLNLELGTLNGARCARGVESGDLKAEGSVL